MDNCSDRTALPVLQYVVAIASKFLFFLSPAFMFTLINTLFDQKPRHVFDLVAITCLLLLGFGFYLQYALGLEPCPMCVVQRYAFVLIAIVCVVARVFNKKAPHIAGGLLMVLLAAAGAFTAARQSWLQWYPPEIASCGRDIYGMVENFPLSRAIPMIFKGSGDCTKVDWTFLGGSIANWSFVCFCCVALVALTLVWRRWQAR